jgi:hypothetical protein
LKRGYELGESRVICGYHWQSDVDAASGSSAAMTLLLRFGEFVFGFLQLLLEGRVGVQRGVAESQRRIRQNAEVTSSPLNSRIRRLARLVRATNIYAGRRLAPDPAFKPYPSNQSRFVARTRRARRRSSAVVATLHTNPAFQQQLQKAKDEFAKTQK